MHKTYNNKNIIVSVGVTSRFFQSRINNLLLSIGNFSIFSS